ncbi:MULTISPECIES: hypothetical protein [Thermoleptolyngbya]|nr:MULTISPECIES: hypothetical protein [Thermoleptolyngbya]
MDDTANNLRPLAGYLMGQGHYWGRPLPPWEVGQWFREFSVKD